MYTPATLLCTLLLPSAVFSAVHSNSSVDSSLKIRGVSLGGWLVLEPWITPEFFEKANDGVPRNVDGTYKVVDEYTWRLAPDGTNDRSAMLIEHWNSWVTQQDINDLAEAGLSFLRIPIGYWYFDIDPSEEPFVKDVGNYPIALKALKRVVNEWAKEAGLQVLIDLHTVPGSQNGFDNSGRRGEVNMLQSDNLSRWLSIVKTMSLWCTDNLDDDVLFGIEIMNEPAGFLPDVFEAVKSFINPNGYAAVREANDDIDIIFQTAFRGYQDQDAYGKAEGYRNVWLDDHNYQAFGAYWNDMSWKPEAWPNHLKAGCDNADNYDIYNSKANTFVGEWSLAVTDCALYLSGGMNGGCNMTEDPSCKYTGAPTRSGYPEICGYYTKNASQIDEEYKGFLSDFARAQMDGFEASMGWFFWNFKTENGHAPAWDYLLGWKEGWMPVHAAHRERYCA